MMVDKLLMGFPQKAAGSNPAGGTWSYCRSELYSFTSDASCAIRVPSPIERAAGKRVRRHRQHRATQSTSRRNLGTVLCHEDGCDEPRQGAGADPERQLRAS
jgi:hypothetical protein